MATAHASPHVDFHEKEAVQRWLEQQPDEIAVTMAARTAMRVLPSVLVGRPDYVLSVFRCLALAWTAARYPGRRPAIAQNAFDAGQAASNSFALAHRVSNAAAAAAYSVHDAHPARLAADAWSFAGRSAAYVDTSSNFRNNPEADPVIALEVSFIEGGQDRAQRQLLAGHLAGSPLWWPENLPSKVKSAWQGLQNSLLAEQSGWEVWVHWYEDRLAGRPSLGEAFDIALATLPDDLWKQGPAVVNARIAELIAEHTSSESIGDERSGIPAWQALDETTVSHWLGTQPREVAITIAGRAAFRAFPLAALPEIQLLAFLRAALAISAAIRRRNFPGNRAAWVPLRTLSQNSEAGAALNLAAAATLPTARNNIAGFAARSIAAAARADLLIAEETLNDLMEIEGAGDFEARAKAANTLARRRLWQHEMAPRLQDSWSVLRNRMLSAGDGWDVWVDWYEDCLAGRWSVGEAFDSEVGALPNEFWEQEPRAVNAHLKELIAKHTPPEQIPAQGAGPHFALNEDLRIALAPPTEVDAAGGNLGRVYQLLPVVRRAAADLAGSLNPNTQPEISRNLADYRVALAGTPEMIAWGIVFGLGVRLENAAAAARRAIASRLRDPLEDAAQEALDSVLALHGPLILATAEGRELSDEADRFRLTRDQQAALRDDARMIARGLKGSPQIIEPAAAELGEKAAEAIGQGDHPERGTAFGLATVRNVATVLVSAGTLAVLVPAGLAAAGLLGGAAAGGVAWVGYEALKRSQRFTAATSALGAQFDRLHDLTEARALQRLTALAPFRQFVCANEEPLRRIAQNTTQLRWAVHYIDFIAQSRNGDTPAN